ncbi:YfhE family protein [Planococcus beigongshangi]|uniref:YfhE family protein n=1 Tax=Planococcus beigongshangi TaxID=2782536 RepID=UPI00193B378C|nr:YfhE family protein [Planococcus beigongshangi]
MAEDKQPHEKMRDKESDLKAAQKVHYTDDFKKADKAGEAQRQENEEQDNGDK